MTASRLSKKDKSRRKVLGHIVMPHNKSLSLRQRIWTFPASICINLKGNSEELGRLG